MSKIKWAYTYSLIKGVMMFQQLKVTINVLKYEKKNVILFVIFSNKNLLFSEKNCMIFLNFFRC